MYLRLKRLPPLPGINRHEYWYANDEQHRGQSWTATTGNQHNGSSVKLWHFYHPTCVPGFTQGQYRPRTADPFTPEMLLLYSAGLSGVPTGKRRALAFFVRGGKYPLLSAMISHPKGSHNVREVGVQTQQADVECHYRCWPTVRSVCRWYVCEF